MLPSMATLHHHGLRVADVQLAGDFYCAALDGRWLARPALLTGAGAEQAVGLAGAQLRIGIVGFDAGAVELFAFSGAVPDWAREAAKGTIPHLALQVVDVAATLARVEAHGGCRVWPTIDRWGAAHVIYAADPDGNVIELLDRPPTDIAATFVRWFPEADPLS